MKFKIGETNIICSDLESSLKFYKDILGFEIIEYEDGAVRLKCDKNIFLLLPVAKPLEIRNDYCAFPEISFDLIVDDINEAVTYFKSHNVKIIKPLEEGESWIIIDDPDGLAIEVIQI